MTLVDAHVHLWDLGRHELSWWRPGLGLAAQATPADLRAAAAPAQAAGAGLRAAVAVQAGDTRREAAWLTGLRDPLVPAVVLQYDPAGPGWSGVPGPLGDEVRGIRAAVPGRAADLRDVPGLDALLEGAAARGLLVEVLVRQEQLAAVAALAARHPSTQVVLCHLGLGAQRPGDGWARDLTDLGALPNVTAKVSGLVGAAPDDARRVGHAIAVAVDAFGPGRLMFGSDWPMSARVASYRAVVARTADALAGLDEDALADVWGRTAERLYRI